MWLAEVLQQGQDASVASKLPSWVMRAENRRHNATATAVIVPVTRQSISASHREAAQLAIDKELS